MTRVIIPGVTHMAIIRNESYGDLTFFSSGEKAKAFIRECSEFDTSIIDITHGVPVDPTHDEWDMFKWKVNCFISPLSKPLDRYITMLADRFECGMETVRGWADGSIVPPPKTRSMIEEFIRREEAG